MTSMPFGAPQCSKHCFLLFSSFFSFFSFSLLVFRGPLWAPLGAGRLGPPDFVCAVTPSAPAYDCLNSFLSSLLSLKAVLKCLFCIVALQATPQTTEFIFMPVLISCIIAFFIAHCFLSVYEMTVDALLLCTCEGERRQAGSGPLHSSMRVSLEYAWQLDVTKPK